MAGETRVKFNRLTLTESLLIRQLISFHYFEYATGYTFEGEQHDFWELLYVDKGEVEVRADDRTYQLKQGMMIFHKPEEFHTVQVRKQHKPPNLVVISFECDSPPMRHLENKVVALETEERSILSMVLKEGFLTFQPPFDNPSEHQLIRNEHAPFSSEQVIKSYLEILMIRLIRLQLEFTDTQQTQTRNPVQQKHSEHRLVQQLIDFMKMHLSESLSLEDLCREAHLGKSRLKELFQQETGTSALVYFKQLKMEEAKTFIRMQAYTLTEIAAKLGYASIHYFSRDFKKMTGMSPSDYARSVKPLMKDSS